MKTIHAAAALAAVFALTPVGAEANPLMTADPVKSIATHDFDDEHAHLWFESRFDRMSQAELAALPKGRSHIAWNAPSNCVPGRLKAVLNRVSAKFGPITVNSSFRSSGKNRKVGGRKRSYHLSCQAVDFRVHGGSGGLMGFLAAQGGVGGLHRYPSGFYHIDTGPRRRW